jgi:hypothetical protein
MFDIVISRWRETYEALKETNDYKTLSAAGSLMKNMVIECVFVNSIMTVMLNLVVLKVITMVTCTYQTCPVSCFEKTGQEN